MIMTQQLSLSPISKLENFKEDISRVDRIVVANVIDLRTVIMTFCRHRTPSAASHFGKPLHPVRVRIEHQPRK